MLESDFTPFHTQSKSPIYHRQEDIKPLKDKSSFRTLRIYSAELTQVD